MPRTKSVARKNCGGGSGGPGGGPKKTRLTGGVKRPHRYRPGIV
jgi:hypothetical protein